MRKIKEVLRLKYDSNLSGREISRSCQVSRSTVADYLMNARSGASSCLFYRPDHLSSMGLLSELTGLTLRNSMK